MYKSSDALARPGGQQLERGLQASVKIFEFSKAKLEAPGDEDAECSVTVTREELVATPGPTYKRQSFPAFITASCWSALACVPRVYCVCVGTGAKTLKFRYR